MEFNDSTVDKLLCKTNKGTNAQWFQNLKIKEKSGEKILGAL